MSLTNWRGLVATPISGLLKQRGFQRSSLKFASIRPEATMLVGLQSSVGSTRELLRITCNLAIVLHALGSRDNHDIWASHWRERIGYFMPEPRDHWWVCSTDDAAMTAGREMAALLESQALPEMERLASRSAMIALWSSGRSPGLTEYQSPYTCGNSLKTARRMAITAKAPTSVSGQTRKNAKLPEHVRFAPMNRRTL